MNKIFSDSVIYVGGELFVKIFPFLLLPVLSRALGPEQYGQISLFNTYVSIFFVFIGLNSSAAIIRYEYTQKRYHSADYFFSSVIILSIAFILYIHVLYVFYRHEIIILAALAGYLQCVYTNLVSVSQARKEAKKYLIAQVLNAAMSFFMTLLFLYYFWANYEARVYAIIMGFLLSIFFASWSNRVWLKQVDFRFETFKKTSLQLLLFGVPLIIHNLSFLARSGLDRIMISKYFPGATLGNYSAAFQLSVIITVVLMALNKALTPHLYSQLRNNKIRRSDFNLIFAGYFFLSILITVVAQLLPEKIYNMVAGEEYKDIKRLVIIMVPAFLAQGFYLIMASTCFFYGKNKAISYCTFTGGIVHCVILYFVCKFMNVFCVPWVLFFSNSFVAFLMYITVFRTVLSQDRRGKSEH
ncbi:oligosaccharide flippase family protein [Rahnella perminowiae]|uniref:oligosaccharide flippase family protein n=1 Tax=Rahnella perminowiae TaxID=2816244 RepID=UPI001C25AA23|nr:oligosaccharide flippase family protein [Rahnella perminowiae]MBU9823611.1 oligosaccharide flippase family protein [Rahnella perminowiae]